MGLHIRKKRKIERNFCFALTINRYIDHLVLYSTYFEKLERMKEIRIFHNHLS